jgi:hypothetical protein
MRITTILVNETPKVVVRPVDRKDLMRFLRNANRYLCSEAPEAVVSHRDADETEADRWRAALQLHTVWGGSDENFFGIPL